MYLLLIIFLSLCVALCFLILLQEGKSDGVGSMFGAGSADSFFGISTASVLKKITAYLSIAFFLLCFFFNLYIVVVSKNRANVEIGQYQNEEQG